MTNSCPPLLFLSLSFSINIFSCLLFSALIYFWLKKIQGITKSWISLARRIQNLLFLEFNRFYILFVTTTSFNNWPPKVFLDIFWRILNLLNDSNYFHYTNTFNNEMKLKRTFLQSIWTMTFFFAFAELMRFYPKEFSKMIEKAICLNFPINSSISGIHQSSSDNRLITNIDHYLPKWMQPISMNTTEQSADKQIHDIKKAQHAQK